MADRDNEPVFLSGGMRAGEPPRPQGLPGAEAVVRGTVMLDTAGERWRSTGTDWVHVVIVTEREHRTLVVRTLVVGGVALLAFAFVAVIGVGAVFAHSTVPVLGIAPLLVVACGFGFWWTRLRRRLASQDVVPGERPRR